MSVRQILVYVLYITTVFIFTDTPAQRTLVFNHPDNPFHKGVELYNKQKYVAAQECFRTVVENYGNQYAEVKKEAAFYNALCAAELYNEDAEFLFFDFINTYPGSYRVNQAYFELGKFSYVKKQYNTAVKWFSQVDKYRLNEEELVEYNFKLGYCYFKRDEYDQARVAFYEIMKGDNKYASPAIYYYSHIAYEQKNYETALEGFINLSEDETFAPIIPYYISQIYYLQKKWDKIIEYAPDLMETVSEKRYPEMAKIIGEAYYNLEEYNKSVTYLKKYHERTSAVSKEDNYQMGFAFYMTGDYEKARDYFKMVSIGKSVLAQSALYHLADCYMKLDDKNQSRLAFASASRMDFDPRIQEDALFNYAVVTYELSYSPFNEAVRALNQYISLYPASERTDEAYNYLVLAYMNTKNYRAALASLDKIRTKDNDIEKAYQRVAFFRGLELFSDLQFNEAINKFDLSLKYNQYDRALKALCYYWKGECYYRLKNYDQAQAYYTNFISTDGSFELKEYNIAHYNMAYACFKKTEYQNALTWFRKYERLNDGIKDRILGDTYNRIADLYYIDSKYPSAIEYYDKAIALGMIDVDYALFQKAISLGITNRHPGKIAVLSQLLEKFENSTYLADALYELGRSHFILKQQNNAIPYYNQVLAKYPNSTYASKAMVQLGLIYYNQDDNDEALKLYKQVVEGYPGTPEADNALLGLKNVYVDMNRVDDYFDYVNSLEASIDISMAEQDSLTYLTAENIYMNGDCERAQTDFSKYIERFPMGRYLVNAHYYKAECHLRQKEYENALPSFTFIISQPRNEFTEPALVSAARINYYMRNFQDALEDYLMLEEVADLKANLSEARTGKMRCYYLLKEYQNTIDAARDVLRDEKISEELAREAHYKIAHSFYEQDRFVLAQEEFMKVAREVKSIQGAEAKYRVAEIYYIRKEYKHAEDEIFDFIEKNTPHQFWMAKAFILLSDIYMEKDDPFQAIATLQSIIDYYEETEDGIIDLAMRKKQEITRRQNQQELPGEEDAPEIELEENTGLPGQ